MLHAMTARCALIALLCGPAAAAEIAHSSSWIGNTWAQPVDGRWVQSFISDLYVAADGTCYADHLWDEAGATGALYRGGTTMVPAGHMFGWGCSGSNAVTANATHVFFAMSVNNEGGHLVDAGSWPPAGRKWYGLTRRLRSDITKADPFAGARGGAGDTLAGSFLVVSEVADGVAADVAGLACDDSRIWYADPQAGLVRIIDARSMAILGSFPFAAPGKIALDRAGTLWIAQTTTRRIVHCSAAGAPLGGDIADAGDPTALAIDPDGRLLVGDSSARSQVLTYDIAGAPRLVATFGDAGGAFGATPGAYGDRRLAKITGVGMDAARNLYVNSAIGGADLRAFAPDGRLLWRNVSQTFDQCALCDPASDGTRVLTRSNLYAMDYTKPPGHQWTDLGATLDPVHYPTDPRLIARDLSITPSRMHVIQGRTYVQMDHVIYRRDGQILVPCAWFVAKTFEDAALGLKSPEGRSIWRDRNGDGNVQNDEFGDADGGWDWEVFGFDLAADGDFYEALENGLRWFPLQGIDANGTPIWTRASARELGLPAPFTKLERVRYEAATDTMYLAGYTADHPKTGSEWGCVGREVARYDGWKAGNRTPRWRATLPYPDPNNAGFLRSWAVAGDYVFVALLNSQGAADTATPRNVYAFDANTGAPAGELLPGSEIGRHMSWVDINDGITAFKRASGEYVLFQPEVFYEYVIMYRFGGGGAQRGPYRGAPSPIPGTIQAEDFDEGGEGVAYHDLDAGNNGGGYRATGVDIRGCVDAGGGWQVGWMGGGEWLEYTVSIAAAGVYDLTARVASGSSGATIHCSLDGAAIGAPLSFGSTGGWDTWTSVTRSVTLPAGVHVVRLSVDSGSLDLNWLRFVTSGGSGTGDGSGLSGEYFDNPDFTAPRLMRTDPTVAFDWGLGSPDPAIGADTFSARWTGQILPRFSETYTFTVLADDGVRLWIDNRLIVDRWIDQAQTECSGSITLTAGRKVDVRLEYYENGGGAVAKLLWASASQGKQIVPTSQLFPAGAGSGLFATYCDDRALAVPTLSRVDPTIAFDWGLGSPDPAIAPDTFSARWTGQLQPAYSETYTLSLIADDGVRLWLDGRLVIDRWVDQAPTECSGAIALVAGRKYDLRLEYYENGGGAVAKLLWASPSQAKQIVPSASLFPLAPVGAVGQAPVAYGGVPGSGIGGALSALLALAWSLRHRRRQRLA